MRKNLGIHALSGLLIVLLSSCGTEQNRVEIVFEDGVEVVINHLEPYEIEGESSRVRLERLFSIDMEDDHIAEIGLTSIYNFDVDEQENIYFTDTTNPDYLIFKFDPKGRFVSTFGRKGQGPGEIESGGAVHILKNIIVVGDVRKIHFFDTNSRFLNEIRREGISGRAVTPLENGKYLAFEVFRGNPDLGYIDRHALSIFDPECRKLKELTYSTNPYPSKGEGYLAVRPYVMGCVHKDRVFIGNSQFGSYEIQVFALDGRLVRKIKKEYSPVKITAEEKKNRMSRFDSWSQIMEVLYCPDEYPPYQRLLFTDDSGRLYVMTYEKGENPGEYFHDIFNPAGAFTGRIVLDNGGQWDRFYTPLQIISKHGLLYHLREKDSSYLELVVSRMIWE